MTKDKTKSRSKPLPLTDAQIRRLSVRQVLDLLDIYLKGADDRDSLWNVLTALRGPDESKRYKVKPYTTAVIRTAAFPRTSKVSSLAAQFALFGTEVVHIPSGNRIFTDHFYYHIREAARVLDLTTTNERIPSTWTR